MPTTIQQSLFHPSKFSLQFNRIANTVLMCTKVDLPGASIETINQPTPWINLPVPGNKLTFDPLTVTFLVDVNLNSWSDIFNWMFGVSGTSFSDYANLANNATSNTTGATTYGVRPPYSDGTLTLYSPKNNPILRFQFFDLFPIVLSPLEFDYSQSADQQIVATATFRYSYYINTTNGISESAS
jgi:hypothetical protein